MNKSALPKALLFTSTVFPGAADEEANKRVAAERVQLNQTLENWAVLQRLRIPSRLIVWPEGNHWITQGEDSRYCIRKFMPG